MVLVCTQTQASPYSLVYSDTVSYVFDAEASNVEAGDTAVITIVVDNGGESLLEQNWGAEHLVSLAFNFGDGKLVTSFSYTSGVADQDGVFSTDGWGDVRGIPNEWKDLFSTSATSNSTASEFSWFINGFNSPYIDGNGVIDLENAGDYVPGMDASLWTISATPIPEPSTYAAFAGLAVMGAALFRRRRHA